jgi:hypothetical protein
VPLPAGTVAITPRPVGIEPASTWPEVVIEFFQDIGGRTRTRTLDPLIKSYRNRVSWGFKFFPLISHIARCANKYGISHFHLLPAVSARMKG